MTISSMESLEAIPIGHTVRIEGNDWLRTEKGLARDGTDLSLHYFEGRIQEGTMQDVSSMDPEPDEWWAGATRFYYLTDVTDTHIHYVSWRGTRVINYAGSSARSVWAASASLHRIPEAPEALAEFAPWARHLALVFRERRVADRQVRELLEQVQQQRNKGVNKGEIRSHIAVIRIHLASIEELLEE